MVFAGLSRNFSHLREPFSEDSLGNQTLHALILCRLAVATWFALHKDELSFILDDGVRLVRFSVELNPILDFV